MTTSYHVSGRLFICLALLLFGLEDLSAAKQQDSPDIAFSRQVTFELTFSNQDMIWLGDPASPTASAYPRPGAQPIATDMCVRTLVEDNASPSRRYFNEARIVKQDAVRKVYAFTSKREKVIGSIDSQGRFSPNQFYKDNRELLPSWPLDASILAYDAEANALYYDLEVPGPLVTESLDFLPLEMSNESGDLLTGRFSIEFSPADVGNAAGAPAEVLLVMHNQGEPITLARAVVPRVFNGDDIRLGSFDNQSGTYLKESVYRAGAKNSQNIEPSVTVSFAGEFSTSVRSDSEGLVVQGAGESSRQNYRPPASIAIDGNFDDWRNVEGIDDPRGDMVPYLEYVPDVDLLEFKVAHDQQHIYLYARVAGKVGHSHPNGGRSYFYAYMDVDQNPGTGFLPTRDDDCYFGVDIGDDCEVQFEFVDNTFRKTFYGFCGIGGDDNVLQQQVTIGKSQYGRHDPNGVERANYKSEYIFRDGVTEITEDLKLGTSDTIHLAVSPDGSEVEVVSSFTGFLKNPQGEPTVKPGQTIDIALGMECDSKAYLGKSAWAADSTRPIRGYKLTPIGRRNASRQSTSK